MSLVGPGQNQYFFSAKNSKVLLHTDLKLKHSE